MSQQAVARGAAWPHAAGSRPPAQAWEAPDARRWLQLGLAAIWLLDAVLQCQSFMFTRAFGQMLAGTADGNPAVIAGPITWVARIVEQHPTVTNAAFAAIQLLIGLGITWRPAIRVALAASIGWSVAVWWFGEGLGGVLAGTASPVNGAPGAAIIYALLAVLLWPAGRPGEPASFAAARAVGARTARVLWLGLWGSLAWFAVGPAASRAPQGLHDMISGMASGQPGWLAATDNGAARLLAHDGLGASVVLAVVLTVIAAGVFAPPRAARAVIVLAVVIAAVIWAIGQDFGGIFTGSATDPNSGLLLGLLAVAYWPRVTAAGKDQASGPEGRR
jgi:hypothetical protein